jgi:hypothetical protein
MSSTDFAEFQSLRPTTLQGALPYAGKVKLQLDKRLHKRGNAHITTFTDDKISLRNHARAHTHTHTHLQVSHLTDTLKRNLAEMENLRMRTSREVENAKKFAIQVREPAHLFLGLVCCASFWRRARNCSQPKTLMGGYAEFASVLSVYVQSC